MTNLFKKNRGNEGLTLVEMLVSIFVFSLVMVVITNFFLSSVRMQARISEEQKMLREISYAMEYMTRAIRMAARDGHDAENERPDCISGIREGNYSQNRESELVFLNYDRSNCREFYLDEGLIKERFGGERVALTSSDFEVEELSFGSGGTDWRPQGNDQSRVTIYIEMRSKDFEEVSTQVQTTVTQRRLNVLVPPEPED